MFSFRTVELSWKTRSQNQKNDKIKNAEAEKADIDMQVITTKQGKTAGYMWVKYSALYYDQNDELIHGVNDAYARWEMERKMGFGW